MRLPINRIHCYAGNPRRQINPEYDRIKASIRAEGLDQPLVVTQKPGDTDYLLQAGGNTRLAVLKALYAETGEVRFESIDCLIKPWLEESSVLLAHLRENELRGELSFIDKAQAVFEAKRLLEVELGIPELSQRRLEQLFKERGFPLGNAIISKMGYAVQTLLPLIPQALGAGLGRPQVEKIRALERAVGRFWTARQLGDETEFRSIFATLCQRYDAPDWDLESLRNALENEIAEAAEQSVQTIRLALGELLSGRALTDFVVDKDESADDSMEAHEACPAAPVKPLSQLKPSSGDLQSITHDRLSATSQQDEKKRDTGKVASEIEAEGAEGVLSSTTDILSSLRYSRANEVPSDLQSLRIHAHLLASRLAQHHGLGDLVIPMLNQGLGFLLRDVPDSTLSETLDPALLGQVSTLWWQLAACAEMTVAPLESIIQHLDEQSILRQALAQQDAGLLFDSVWTLDPGQVGHQLWRQLSDNDWQDCLALMDTYRQLHQCAAESGVSLWD